MDSSAARKPANEPETRETADRAESHFEPRLVWSEELEKRRLAVARWRGLESISCNEAGHGYVSPSR